MPFGLSALAVKVLAGLALVAAALLAFGLWSAHEQSLGAEKVRADVATQALAGERAARAESDRRTAAIQEKADHADLAASAARADLAAATDAAGRLRLRLAAAERRRTAGDSAAADPGPAADSPALVPYDVFARVDDAAGQLGGYADQLRVSLEACVGSYQALSTPR